MTMFNIHANANDFPPPRRLDRAFYLLMVLLVWAAILSGFIPPRHEIPVIVFEANPTTPVGNLLDEDTEARIQRFFPGTE